MSGVTPTGPHPVRRDVLAAGAVGVTSLVLPAAVAAASDDGPTPVPGPSILTAGPAGYYLADGTGTEAPAITGAIELTWTAITGAEAYIVRVRPNSAGPSGALTDAGASATTRAVVTGISSIATYDLVVAATGTGGVAITEDSSPVLGVGTVIATGGDVSTFVGNGSNGTLNTRYVVHSFPTAGASAVTFERDVDVDLLLVGGGGAGASLEGGGGGGGGMVEVSDHPLRTGTHAVSVGAGGTAVANRFQADSGGNSTFSEDGALTDPAPAVFTALGGGGGGADGMDEAASPTDDRAGADGGSGGGGGGNKSSDTDASGGSGLQPASTSGGSGNDGGDGASDAGGGGGGAGAAGAPAPAGTAGDAGAGGAGRTSTITGGSVAYAGGGGGGSTNGTGGTGGIGGGGAGGSGSGTAVAGTGGRGGGGGGGGSGAGAGGGSGVVIVRYALPA